MVFFAAFFVVVAFFAFGAGAAASEVSFAIAKAKRDLSLSAFFLWIK